LALIKQESIQEVLDACDMIEIVSPHVTLKKSGGNYMGRCPFHNEKTPSFSVDPAQKLYYCFGCGEGGNVFSFVEQKEGLDFADAVKFLADKYGVRLEFEQSTPEQDEKRHTRERDYSLLDQVADYYTRILWQSKPSRQALAYLRERGFTDDVIKEFRLGLSPVKGDTLVKAAAVKGYGVDDLVRTGLVIRKGSDVYDRFRGRLMFPFTDHRGRVLGFGARVLGDGKPKYLNSPETDLYHKSNLLFGLGNARQAMTKEDRAYIVEGYTDVIALHQVGVRNAVASMGTALTEQQLREVARFTRNVYLAFDADAAGQKAMLRAQEIAVRLSLAVHVIVVPDEKDPAEVVLEASGERRFRELADGAPTLLEYRVHASLSASDSSSAEGRVEAFSELKKVLAGSADPVERDELIRVVSDRLRLSTENVAYLMESAPKDGASDDGGRERRVLSQEEITERNFLSLCIARPREARRYIQEMTEAHFTTDTNRSAFLWVKQRLSDDGNGYSTDSAPDPTDLRELPILPELLIRAETEVSEPEALPELFLRLCQSELQRRIDNLKASIDADDDTSEEFQKICRLENRRRKILDLIQTGSFESLKTRSEH
jgi:DNA primase